MKTIKISITTKKNTTIDCTFLISQVKAFPRITSYGSGYSWENGDGLFPQYGNKATGLKNEYHVVLLRSDLETEPTGTTRQEYAGWDGNPGTIVFRGRDLGEMTFIASVKRDWPNGYYINNSSIPEVIRDQINPIIAKFIEKNKKSLKKDAIKAVQSYMAEQISGMRNAIKGLEVEATKAIETAKEGV